MFQCERCKQITALREPCNRLVVETRPKIYETKIEVGDEIRKIEKVITSRGTEIVKELKLCGACYLKNKSTYE